MEQKKPIQNNPNALLTSLDSLHSSSAGELVPLGTSSGPRDFFVSNDEPPIDPMVLVSLDRTPPRKKRHKRAFSSYLLRIPSHDVLVDAGSFRIRSFPFDFSKLQHLFLTHSHLDHVGNFGHLINRYIRFWKKVARSKRKKLHIYFPVTSQMIITVLSVCIAQSLFNLRRFHRYITLHPLGAWHRTKPTCLAKISSGCKIDRSLSSITVSAAPAGHLDGSLGYAFEIANFVAKKPIKITIVPDSSWEHPPIIALGKNSDYFFHDCAYSGLKWARKNQLEPRLYRKFTHSTPELAARTARKAGARVFGAIHYSDDRFPDKHQMRERIASQFSGKIILTQDLQPIPLAPTK